MAQHVITAQAAFNVPLLGAVIFAENRQRTGIELHNASAEVMYYGYRTRGGSETFDASNGFPVPVGAYVYLTGQRLCAGALFMSADDDTVAGLIAVEY